MESPSERSRLAGNGDGQTHSGSSQTGADQPKLNSRNRKKWFSSDNHWDNLSAFFTIVLAFVLGGVLRRYDKARVLTEDEQKIFYAVTEGLIIFLGLNNNKALVTLMLSFRSWSLQGKLWSERNKRAVDKVTDFTSVMKLVVVPGASWSLSLVALLWLIFVLAAQALTAFITYGYSTQDGNDYNGTYVTTGTVNVSDLACFNPAYYPGIGCGLDDDVGAAQAIAHAYGDVDQDLHCRELDHFSDIFASRFDEDCFALRDTHQIIYRFDEYNPDDVHRAYPRFSNRTIVASVDGCSNYTQTAVESLSDGESRYTFENSTFTGSLVIPDYLVTDNGTTYIYRDPKPPQSAEEYACGPRCMRMWAHGPLEPDGPPKFYECAVSISEVNNATAPEHHISNDVARLVAASIGTSGHQYKASGNWTQFQLYPFGSTWNALSHYSSHPEAPPSYLRPGDIMATNALMAIAVMAKNSRSLQMEDGLVPVLGSRLTVDWPYLVGVLCAIIGGHLLVWGLCWCLDERTKARAKKENGGLLDGHEKNGERNSSDA